MHRFRSTRLALIGGALLVTLSVSAAFGAAPAGTRDATRGQTIAALVHELIFGTDEEPLVEEPVLEEEPLEEEPLVEEPVLEEEPLVEEEDEADDSHGECVSEVAQDPEAIGGPNENHGGAVSEAARVTCWETDENEDEPLEETTLEEEVDEEETDSHGACVSEVARDVSAVGGKNDNHGGAVSEAARVTCREGGEEPEGEPEAVIDETDDELTETASASSAKPGRADAAARGNGKPSWAGNGGQGGGNGRGGGRP